MSSGWQTVLLALVGFGAASWLPGRRDRRRVPGDTDVPIKVRARSATKWPWIAAFVVAFVGIAIGSVLVTRPGNLDSSAPTTSTLGTIPITLAPLITIPLRSKVAVAQVDLDTKIVDVNGDGKADFIESGTQLVAVAQPDHAFKLDAGLSGLLAAAIGAVVALVGNRRKPEAETAKKLAEVLTKIETKLPDPPKSSS